MRRPRAPLAILALLALFAAVLVVTRPLRPSSLGLTQAAKDEGGAYDPGPSAPHEMSDAAVRAVEGEASASRDLPGDPLAVLRLPGDAMLVRTGSASIEVDSLGLALARAHELAARAGGFVAGTQAQAGRGSHRLATLELRVPTARFDELVQGIGALGSVEQVSVSTEEVGEEYTDVAARVANGRKLEARLLDLLAARTGKLQDALTVERELARVREEIERHEARLRYLQSRAATSRLTLSLHEPLPVLAGPSPITQAARQAWRNFVELTAAAIALLGVAVPLGLAGAGAWWTWRHLRRPAPAVSQSPLT